MDTKRCFKCGTEKPLSDFYKHSQMKDGYLNKCIVCSKRDVNVNRELKRDYYILYDRLRYDEKGPRGELQPIERQRIYKSDWSKKNNHKRQAHLVLKRAIESGLITRCPCEICGESISVEAHHTDYSKPLEVQWLCKKHHGLTRKKSRSRV